MWSQPVPSAHHRSPYYLSVFLSGNTCLPSLYKVPLLPYEQVLSQVGQWQIIESACCLMQNVLVLCKRPWPALLAHLVPCEPQGWSARQCSLVHGHFCIPAGLAYAQILCSILSRGLHFHHWPLHLLCYTYLPEDHSVPEAICEGSIPSGVHEHPRGCHCCCMGVLDYGTLLCSVTVMLGSHVMSISNACAVVSSAMSTACCCYSSAGCLY